MTYNMNQIMTNDKEQRIKRMDRDMNCEEIHDGKLFGNSFMTSCAKGVHTLRCALVLLLMVVGGGVNSAWGEGEITDGLYYIESRGNNSSQTSGSSSSYYLCPTEGWYYYLSTSPYHTNTGNGMPFMTTFQHRGNSADADSTKAVWYIKKKPETNYYYFFHVIDGKNLTYNVRMVGTGNNKEGRMRVHLEDSPSDDDATLFGINYAVNYGYEISTKKNDSYKYLNVNDGNKSFLVANGKTDGPNNIATGGIIGLWKTASVKIGNDGADNNSKWNLEQASLLPAPTITNVASGKYTITPPFTLPNGYAIRYTIDDNVVVGTNSGTPYTLNDQITITEEGTLRAWVVGLDTVLTKTAEQTVFSSTPVPTFEVTCDNHLQINCASSSATIYYTVNDANPSDTNGTLYETPFTEGLSDGDVVYAIAYVAGSPSDITNITYRLNTEAPTVSLTGTTATITFGSGTTIHYTTNGTAPDPTDAGESTSPYQITNVSESADVEIRVIATSSGRGNSCPVTVVKRPKKPTFEAISECSDDIMPIRSHTLTFTGTEEGKTYWYALSNGSGQAAPGLNTFTEYTGTPVDIAAIPAWNGTAVTVTLHSYAKDSEGNVSVIVSQDYLLKHTAAPEISSSGNTVTITGAGTIMYRVDGGEEQQYNGAFNVTQGHTTVITATAQVAGEGLSCVSSHTVRDAEGITSLSEITDMNGDYDLLADITVSSHTSFGTSATPFTGSLNGNGHTISGLKASLFGYVNGAKIYNVMLDNVDVNEGSTVDDKETVGAICNYATGRTRIYNCGVLATGSTVKNDEDGYTSIDSCSSTISGSGYVGGIVGLLDGSSRVINCFSYANVSGGNNSYVGGIVGYNKFATTSAVNNLKTMVMNCMFYGEVSGSSIAPIYNGQIITNRGDNSGVGNYNYFRLESSYIQNTNITKVYNCALGAETRFLQRFEFYRHLLNSHRELAGWWATGTYSSSEMMKWVLEPSQIGTATPYPILKTPGKYPSVVNIDAENATTQSERNKGGKLGTLSVNIQMGDGAVYTHPGTGDTEAKITTSDTTLVITDKDPDHFNFNYYKVQLPYYNDVGTKNYTGNRVVTGWKIVSITGGTAGTYSTGEDVTYTNGVLTATPYNFADRNCTNKDLYSVSGRVFNQGAYWDVPYGVTAITIEPYWAKCAYLADSYADVVYNQAMGTSYNVPNVGGGQKYTNRNSYSIAGESQKVFTSKGDAIATSNSGLFQGANGSGDHTVYDYAVVLVGNYHFYGNLDADKSKPYTVTSIDLDGDNEPDYSYILRFDSRKKVHPVRVDFINIPGLGMAQKSHGGTGTYNFGIMQPNDWFESTNTSLFRETQFEYDNSTRVAAPYILQGGVMEQWVNGQNAGHANLTTYFHVGGNVWFKEFHRGTHQDAQFDANHSPISVTGGDFDQFHLTGLYRADVDIRDDNAECYITGGRFRVVAGTGMDGIGHPDNQTNGNITWIIDNADIKEFYAGSFNADKPAQGNLHTIVNGGHIDFFCGGPKFGDMNSGRTVTTTATGCTFGTFFGAGYGGNSYSRQAPRNHNSITNFPHNDTGNPSAGNHTSWNDWLDDYYEQKYNSTYGGVSTQFSYQFLPMSGNTNNVARIFVEYVKFSLATTHSVTSTLKNCTITGNFYGGGSLGKVEGNVTSILDSCTVKGNVFGAGYSASLPTIEVDNIGFRTEPYYYTDLGTYRTGVKGETTTYHWEHANAISIDKNNSILYTTENLDPSNLGSVNGLVTLTLQGNTKVGTLNADNTLKENTGDVYGGGDESYVFDSTTSSDAKTIVNIKGNTEVLGNVFGGGNRGEVSGSAKVNIEE